MIRVAVVDDNAQSRQLLRDYLTKYRAEHDQPMIIEEFADGSDLVGHYAPSFDIIFLDVQMENLDGFATARLVREVHPAVIIIFVTNMAQLAINGYQVATGYYTRAYRIYAVDAPKPTAIAVVPPSALDVNRDLVPDTCQRVGDINGDGVVDGADLGLLLGAWGLTGGLADLNADARVDGADLGILLGNWGG